jgi:hypothetical protein
MLSPNPVFHGRVKHIKVRHHFLRDHVEKGDIEIKYIETEKQMTDIFTKRLNVTRFASLRWEGDLVFAIPMIWFEGDLLHRSAFHSYLPNITLLHLLY